MRDDEAAPATDDDTPLPDPFEAELVAYLDGELDAADARRVEARLATDPAARAKATALKKTYDLLDYLPQTEPSADFTTRTLLKLSGAGVQPQPSQAPRPILPQSTAAHGIPSLSIPVLLSNGTRLLASRPPRRAWRAVGVVVAVLAFASAGYLITSVLHPRLSPTPPRDNSLDNLLISDRGLIERLPLYAAADDFGFVQELAKRDYFGDDPTVSLEGSVKAPVVEPEPVSAPLFDALTKAYQSLPPARQQAIRELDKQLNSQDASIRDRLIRVLEAYAVWLNTLPEAERRGVQAADTPLVRLRRIRDIREAQWLNSLPPAQQARLTGLGEMERGELIQQWKDDEARRRDLWAFARQHATALNTNRQPWPFDTEAGRRDVPEFIRVAFRTDDPRRCRLSPMDLTQYRDALESAQKSNEWAWYGKAVYELTRKYETLPEPGVGEPITSYAQLGPAGTMFFQRGRAQKATASYVGKWPEFARAVSDYVANGEKSEKLPPLPPLGPARGADFAEPVREFWLKELSPVLTQAEHGRLRALEHKWPDYPREFIRLARQHDLSVPGVTLPGSPRKWEATYGSVRTPGPLIRP